MYMFMLLRIGIYQRSSVRTCTLVQNWECRVCIVHVQVCSDAVSSDCDGVPSWLWRLFSAVMGEQFLMYMEAFKPFLHLALKNTEEHTVRVHTAACTFSYMPWLHELALLHQIVLSYCSYFARFI